MISQYSTPIHFFIETITCPYNCQGSGEGQAIGFRLQKFTRILSTRTTDGRSSFLEVAMKAINEQRPSLLSDLIEELREVNSAAKTDINAVLENYNELKSDLKEIVQSLRHEDLAQLNEHLANFIQVCIHQD